MFEIFGVVEIVGICGDLWRFLEFGDFWSLLRFLEFGDFWSLWRFLEFGDIWSLLRFLEFVEIFGVCNYCPVLLWAHMETHSPSVAVITLNEVITAYRQRVQ